MKKTGELIEYAVEKKNAELIEYAKVQNAELIEYACSLSVNMVSTFFAYIMSTK